MILSLIALCLIIQSAIPAGARTARNTPAQAQQLSGDQLDNLLASIALYPDPLLAQVLPACTFVDQIDQAARWLRANPNNIAGIDKQSWDVSVKSVGHYPQVVYMMAEKLDWTTALGQCYVNQSTDVFTAIQRLRGRAKAAGNLVTTKEQQVIVEQEVIKIVPAQPQVIYVPTYNPQVVYVAAPPPSGPSTGTVVAATVIAFGAGLAIGAWLNNDCNWHTHTVYYHGWHGVGWVSTSSHYVHTSSVYVRSSYSTVHVNTAVVSRNVNYNNINHYNSVSRNVNYNNVNVNNVNRNNVNVNNVNTNNVTKNNVNTNNVTKNNVNTNNVTKNNVSGNTAKVNSYRGQTGQSAAASARPAQSSSAFGGRSSATTTAKQSQRGQASRQSAQQSSRGGGRAGGGGGGSRRR
jgi:uncharacterized membrane protein YgcG